MSRQLGTQEKSDSERSFGSALAGSTSTWDTFNRSVPPRGFAWLTTNSTSEALSEIDWGKRPHLFTVFAPTAGCSSCRSVWGVGGRARPTRPRLRETLSTWPSSPPTQTSMTPHGLGAPAPISHGGGGMLPDADI